MQITITPDRFTLHLMQVTGDEPPIVEIGIKTLTWRRDTGDGMPCLLWGTVSGS